MARTPVLLIPGLGGKGSFWSRQVAALSPHFEPLPFDLAAVNTVDALAAHVMKIVDEKKIGKFHVVGQSTGGAIAQVIAEDHPERVEKLVLSGTWAGPTEPFLEQFRVRKEILLKAGPDAYAKSSALALWPDDWLEAHPEILRAPAEPADTPGLLARMDAILNFNRFDRLKDIKARTLVACAEDDRVVPIGHSRRIAAGIPGAKLHLFPRGGHFPQVTAAEDYNAVLLKFLQ